ncbi:MAG: signal peptidase I [Hymenobacter sp.]|nr:MAG: signal peptidase I [Hymenobacter sp.]
MHIPLLFSLTGLLVGIVALVFNLLFFAFFIAIIYGGWKTFEKAGKPGWGILVPIYNLILVHEIVGRDLIKIILLFIPLVNIYFGITLYVSLAKSFGKSSTGDYILAIFFWPFTLGLSNARYVGPSEGPSTTINGFSPNPTTY